MTEEMLAQQESQNKNCESRGTLKQTACEAANLIKQST
jgi:hypothetical protein